MPTKQLSWTLQWPKHTCVRGELHARLNFAVMLMGSAVHTHISFSTAIPFAWETFMELLCMHWVESKAKSGILVKAFVGCTCRCAAQLLISVF